MLYFVVKKFQHYINSPAVIFNRSIKAPDVRASVHDRDSISEESFSQGQDFLARFKPQ